MGAWVHESMGQMRAASLWPHGPMDLWTTDLCDTMRAMPRPRVLVSVAFVLLAAVALLRGQSPDFDVLIAGGRVVDGTGTPWFRGDVGLKGDRIAAIGDLTGRTAARRIDAAGMVVAPGFIDMLGQSEMNLLVDSRAASKVLMGVTTEVTGEGTSIAPVNDTHDPACGGRLGALRHHPGLADAGRILHAAGDAQQARDQPRHVRRRGRHPQLRDRQGQRAGRPRRSRRR